MLAASNESTHPTDTVSVRQSVPPLGIHISDWQCCSRGDRLHVSLLRRLEAGPAITSTSTTSSADWSPTDRHG